MVQYCYAHSTAMLLTTIGEQVPSELIEVLTGVGLGATLAQGKKLLLSSNAPDLGISKALEILGFEFEEKALYTRDAPPPFNELREDLDRSPAVLGPLDMGYLAYMPRHQDLAGVDHYVLAYAIDDEMISVHDPGGYPHALLSLEQFAQAWHAARIPYRRGAYRYWRTPRRCSNPSDDQLYDDALKHFRSIYKHAEEEARHEQRPAGRAAIRAFADRLRGGDLPSGDRDFLIYFALPLGAKRALDFALFFQRHDSALAELKGQQAELLGEAHTMTVLKNWMRVADALYDLADVEAEFEHALRETYA
jgi:hypothetical protein